MELTEAVKVSTETFNGVMIALSLVQLAVLYFAALNLRQQKKQIKALADQLRLQIEQVKLQKSEVYVNSFAHFSNMYLETMSRIPERDRSQTDKDSWWYRYWDILIAEVHFCMRGYMDKLVITLWINELARNFDAYPHGAEHMGTFAENGRKHFDRVLPAYHPVRVFFGEVAECSKLADDNKRSARIRELVERTYRSELSE